MVDATVARLTPSLARGEGAVPLAVHVGDHHVEVFWTGPPPSPAGGFVAAATGWVWTVDGPSLERLLERATADVTASVLPALIPIGATGLGDLWLNVEALRLVHLTGAPDHTDAIGTHLESLLRHQPVDVRTLGSSAGEARGADEPVDSSDDSEALDVGAAVEMARRHRVGVRRLLDEHRVPSMPALRVAVPEGAWAPLVITACDVHDAERESLKRLVLAARGERSGVTCIFVGAEAPSECVRVECGAATMRLGFLGDLEVVIPDLAERAAPRETDEQWRPPLEPASRVQASPAGPTLGSVVVRVLGPVLIDGTRAPLAGKGAELVAYLACNPAGVSVERIKGALWPEEVVAHKSFRNRVWACRQALGDDEDGEPRLRHLDDGVARVADSVSTDLDEVEAGLLAARDAEPDGIARLHAALGAVRGRPFDEPSGYQWAFADLHVAHAERVVTDAATRLAELCLDVGDWRAALWAAEQGQLAVPGSEPLARVRMRAFAAGNDPRGIERALRDLVASLDGDADAIAPETRTLYDQLRAPVLAEGWSAPSRGGASTEASGGG